MSTTFHYLSGKVFWAKVRKPDEKYGNYTLNLVLDEPSTQVFKASGMTMQRKEAEYGTYVTFRRPHQKAIRDEMVTFGPPLLINKDDTEFEGLIGNGSEVTIKVSVYDTKQGKGHRLEAVKVNQLVVYQPPANGAPVAPSGFPNPQAAPSAAPVARQATRLPF